MVSRPAYPHRRADPEPIVDVGRTAPAGRLPQHRDLPAPLIGRVATQRVLAGQPVTQHEVDVSAGRPLWKQLVVRGAQGQIDHALRDGTDLLDDHVCLDLGGHGPGLLTVMVAG